MLEGLAAWVLNNYIGEYVENLNTHQLSIGVFQGQIELENLPLKKDALKKLDLPLEVKSGFIGRIHLSIPVKRLKSEPWVITLEKLYLIAGPIQNRQYNEKEEKQKEFATKELQLKALEEKWKQEEGLSTGSSMWSVTPMFTNILENIQLKVKDVHIRYEDDVTIPQSSFACGITIKSLSAQSTDGSWLPKFVSKYDTDMMRKLVDLQGFSAYWDTDCEMVGDLSRSELEDVLQRPMFKCTKTGQFKDHEFLLEPVSAQAKMKRNTSALPLRSANSPRITLDIQLEKIPLSLSEKQYRGTVAWMKEFTRYEKWRKYRKWRPACSVKEDPRAWWKYAIDANLHVVQERNQRCTVEYMTKRCRDNCLYVDAYIDYVAIGTTYMEDRLKEHMDQMEHELTFEDIKVLREVARTKMKNTLTPKSDPEPNNEQTASSADNPASPGSGQTAELTSAAGSDDSAAAASEQGQGLFQRWFPGWAGWYGSYAPSEPLTREDTCQTGSDINSMAEDQNFEQEVMDILNDTEDNNTLLRRDTVFAQVNFQLQSGVFRLLHDADTDSSQASLALLELECSEISMDLESRPRTNGMRFGIRVGGLYLRDKMTANSIMPVLIAPQHRERASTQSRQLFTGVLGTGLGRVGTSLPTTFLGTTALSAPVDHTLFELVYEKKPPHCKADYRLDIKTKPLDILYNPTAIKRVKDFFAVKTGLTSVQSDIELAAAAKSRYEAIKKQTEEELKHTIDEILEQEDTIKAKRWSFNLDIAAPQIIIPLNFTEINTTLVVFDLGRLQFQNVTAGIKDDLIKPDEDEEEDFVTPSSTPPQELEEPKVKANKNTTSVLSDIFSENLSEAAIRDKIYDKYKLSLSELQVMVGKSKDNWRFAHTKGTSHLHIVDKFSISLQLDRRLLYTSDPQWPKATMAGTLPSLTLHVNETKIQALKNCAELLTESNTPSPITESRPITETLQLSEETQPNDKSMYYSMYQAYSKSFKSRQEGEEEEDAKQTIADSVFCLVQFTINRVSLEVQSRGRSIAELQVQGVNANFTMRPFDTSVSFSLHSLLVVDALQTFGPDFELLVASHKNLCLDSQSGSIRDSEPNSPRSPQSPTSPSSPAEPDKPMSAGLKSGISVVHAASSALQGLTVSGTSTTPDESPVLSPGSLPDDTILPSLTRESEVFEGVVNSDALIKVELDLIRPNCPTNTSSDETLHIANIQFNNLDFIANQQTLMELIGFFHRVLPSGRHKSKSSESLQKDEQERHDTTIKNRWEFSAEFHRLNILLMRVEEKEVGHKVATATVSGARVGITLASQGMTVKGSLGGVQVQNITADVMASNRHQKVLSVGCDPHNPTASPLASQYDFKACADLYQTATSASMFLESGAERAFTFSLFKPTECTEAGPEDDSMDQLLKTTEVVITLKLASVCYTHSPDFLKELSMCVTEFKGYMTNVGSSLKVAAREMAIGLVNQRSDAYAVESNGVAKGRRAPSMGDLILDPTFDSFSQSMEDLLVPDDGSRMVIKLDVNLETPVILLPRRPDSGEVLVAHLGRISIRNFDHPVASTFSDAAQFHRTVDEEKIYIEVRDMSMYSVNLDKQKLLEQNVEQTSANMGLGPNTSAFLTPQPGGYVRTSYGIPILHDTLLELTIEKREPLSHYSNRPINLTVGDTPFIPFPQKDDLVEPTSSVLQVNGRLISPLKLALSKEVYEQILQTLDNLMPSDDENKDTMVNDFTPTSSSIGLDQMDPSEDNETNIPSGASNLALNESSSSAKLRAGPLRDASSVPDENMIFKAYFEMPVFSVELTGDLGEGEQGLVDLKLEDFKVNFEKADPWTKSIEISLQSLIMEDLLQDKNSKQRYLMVSTGKPPTPEVEDFHLPLSQSCPTAMIDVPPASLPNSLPSSFHEESVFVTAEPRTRTNTAKANVCSTARTKNTSGCPCTPPPSLQMSRRVSQSYDNRLVHIKILLVEKRCPEFKTKYNSTNRFIDVDFNGLDTTINLQTWVVLLDFLGMGAKVHNTDTYEPASPTSKTTPKVLTRVNSKKDEQEEVTNSEIDLKVQSLSLILNKAEYELAKANISRFDSHVTLRDGTFAIKGQLGSMSVRDESPHGSMYREKFTTTGNQALDFSIFNYGSPDPLLTREHDIAVNLRMNSVWYVHTQRFLMETLAFAQNFNQLQDVLGRMRAASAGQKISEKAFRGSRIKFDIEAGAPIIFIPHSSKSTDILVIDLGAISIHNTFMKAGCEGTISFQRNKLQKEKAAESEDADAGSDSKRTFSDVSSTCSSAYVTCRSGLPMEKMSSPSIDNALMTQSTYGSLDEDSRGTLFESWDTFSESSHSVMTNSGGLKMGNNSLPSFCSSVGVGFSRSSSVSTAIGEQKHSTPNRSRSDLNIAGSSQLISDTVDMRGSLLAENHKCLLDVLSIELTEMDLFSAEWINKDQCNENDNKDDLVFPSYVVKREPGKVLKEKGRLTLQVERNLEGDISHNVPDISIDGKLTSVHFQLDVKQYKMVRGFLAHNFGEDLEPFQTPMMSQLQDPQIHTVLSGNVWKAMSINLDLDGVTAELLICHGDGTPNSTEVSLAKFEFITSRLSYDSFSDGSKDIDLVSHEIRVLDTRYRDSPVNVRPNVFPEILKPSVDRAHPKALQMELHYRSTKQFTRFTILLNNMRVMGIFDWLLACKDFLLTAPDNPYEDRNRQCKAEKTAEKLHRQESSPATVSTGVVTKRASSLVEKKETSFELRLNVTDTELVVVEDTTGRDSNAVILKSTAVFSYKPDFPERPVSCSLQSLEVFSCSLAAEDETALSIIDPMSITIELNGSPSKKVETLGPTGLTDATSDSDSDPPILEISFTTLNVRLSYNDMMLFLAIMKTVPDQLIQAKHQGQPPKNATQCQYPVEQIRKLEKLGFSRADSEMALSTCQGQLDEAAMWLTQNALPANNTSHVEEKDGFILSGFEVKASAICVCFIDDCLDADVPLAELTFSGCTFLHRFCASGKGKALFKLTGDYYNRSLSGWEPFIETWGCIMTWNEVTSEENRMQINIEAGQVLNFNFTSSLLEQYRKTKVKWTKDYYKQETQSPEEGSYNSRKRIPFIPFAIRNQTGCKLWFATMTTKPTRIGTITSPGCSKDSSQRTISEWRMVASGDELPFLFEERDKIRHKHTHELKVHQVIVQVEGWREVSAVSVDKVGTYFRTARPEVNPSNMYSKPPARIVFDVTLEGSAHKVITVRSGLMVQNKLDDDVEIRLQNTLAIDLGSPIGPEYSGNEKTLVVKQGAKQAVPIPLVHSRMWIRPQGWSLDWCKQPVLWQHVNTPGEPSDSMKSCTTIFSEKASYRFCVSVYRQHFPPGTFTLGQSPAGSPVTPTEKVVYNHPGHIITLMPPVMLENLLPIDVCYSLKSGNQQNIRGSIKPGKVASLFAADLSQNLELGISFDNMTTSKNLVIPPGTLDYRVKLVLFDSLDRPLELIIRIKAGIGGSLKLSVSAPYWLINRTGLPLIFKQEGAQTAAGQFEEHELARSVVPLLFSYTEKEKHNMCTVRLGKYIHGVNSKALWTNMFSLESGSGVRELHVSPNDNRPDWVYMIGIEVKQGKGRYYDTNIVTFSPRYQLDNHSSHKLAFAQKYAVVNWSPSSVDYFSALPNCTLSFHWPRVDKDNLLCVQLMNDPDSQWSGGFVINKVDSFHINIRSKDNKCIFLRVDVVLHGATYYVVLSDANHMPPPYRIENHSEVPVVFYQTNTRHELRSIVRPHSQVPYALDEPVLPPHITLKVIGGSSATYNLHNVKAGDQLYYENHIYLAFTGTFKSSSSSSPRTSNWVSHMEQHQLVLDVLPNNRVVLKKMEAGKRSQLWRMTSRGMLQHEGSAAPRDPGKSSASSSPSSSSSFYVLDIADYQLRPDAEMGLAIRKAEDKRKATQHWMFTKDGRLICSSRPNLCVQAKGGIFGLRDGEDAVLGPSPPKIADRQDVPIEMAVHNEKSRPGSGQLFVKVLVDGPTRVLRITDVTQQRLYLEQADDWLLVDGAGTKLPSLQNTAKSESNSFGMYEVNVALPEGIGLSLINAVPEELLYVSLRDIQINYMSTEVGQKLEMRVSKFQIDNQLFGQYRPVLLFVTQNTGHHEEDKGAALQVSVHKVPNSQWNADIYKHFIITMKHLTVQIEETLLWKFVQFFDFQQNESDIENISETGIESNRDITAATSVHLKRYYFGILKIDIHRVVLSMLTASELSPELKVLKKSLGVPLVRFADAQVDLEPFVRHHPFETSAFLIESIQHHFTEELKSQAASILGSVDFLGNPLGFVNDVAEGVSGLLEGNVGGLLKNVTHGVSNSAAKVTGSLSDGVGVVTLDNHHQKIRQQIRYASEASGGSDHLKAGFKALGHGLFGGLTSIVAQTYTGVAEDGFEGFFTGLGKGVVGTVTKPVAGVLDFAAGAASAVRDTSRSSSKVQPSRVRKPRVCQGPGGLLPAYSEQIASGQEYLHKINDNNYNEICIAVEVLRGGRDDTLRALISSEHVYLLAKNPRDKEYVILDPSYDELINCRAVVQEGKPYLMLTMKADTDSGYDETGHKKSPLVRCDTERIAQKVSQQINYAKVLYDEVKHTLPTETDREDTFR